LARIKAALQQRTATFGGCAQGAATASSRLRLASERARRLASY